MCFSATANFIASAGIAAVGVATLRHVRQPRAILFAAMPIFFALHQFSEGFVWLGLNHEIPQEAEGHVVFLFILYAQGILPLLMPLATSLIEPPGWRRRVIAALTAVGAAECAYIFYALITYPSTASIEHHSVHYSNPLTATAPIVIIYLFVTCGSLIASTHKVVRWFGWLNLAGVVVTLLAASYAFTSIWCLYAAVISIMLYWQFSQRKINLREPNTDLAEGREPTFA